MCKYVCVLFQDKNGRILGWLVTVVVGAATFGAILGSAARSSTSINPEGMNDDQLYCIANDWRSRDWKAKKFRTMTHCRFSQVSLILFKQFIFLKLKISQW